MKFDAYQKAAARTLSPDQPLRDSLANFALGLTGEAGEAVDGIKKHLYHGHDLDLEHLKNELGDVLWYIAGIASVTGLTLEEIAEGNIAKLRSRYPDGFNHEDSRKRVDVT